MGSVGEDVAPVVAAPAASNSVVVVDDLDPLSLPRWLPPPGRENPAGQGSLLLAFRRGLTMAETTDALTGQWKNTARMDWMQTLFMIAAHTDALDSKQPVTNFGQVPTRHFLLESASPSSAIFVTIHGARAAPSLAVSWAGVWLGERWAGDVDTSRTPPGPLLVVSYLDLPQGRARYPRRLALPRDVQIIPCEAPELEFARREIADGVKLLSSEAVAAFERNGADNFGGLCSLSVFRVKKPVTDDDGPKVAPELTLDPPCALEGCSTPGLLKCAKCHTAYCSKDHQKADWKAGHKQVCESRASGQAVVARAAPPSPSPSPPAPERKGVLIDHVNRTTPMTPISGAGRYTHPSDAVTMVLPYRAAEFVVKVQVPTDGSGGGPFVYDEGRVVNNIVPMSEPGVAELAQTVRRCTDPRGRGGLKCFLWARTEAGRVRVFLDKYAPWQRW